MFSLACFIGLELSVSASSDGVERSDMEGAEGDGEVTPFVEGDTGQATVREKVIVHIGGKLRQGFMVYA